MNLDSIREEFPVTKEYVYLDNASCSPLPNRSISAVVDVTKEKAYGDIFWEKWDRVLENVRGKISSLLNTDPKMIALTPNTSEGVSIVANGLRYTKGSNIVTTDMEFPSNLYPWQVVARRLGVELRVVENDTGRIPIERFEKAVDDDTVVVAVSHVQYSNGFTIDLKALSEMVHDNGAFLFTDAVQSLGQMPVDVKELDVDFLATSGYKWLLSPIGTGFLYVKRDLIDELDMSMVGYRSSKEMYNFSFRSFDPSPDAKRFEHGQPNFPGFAGMAQSIDLLMENGIGRIWDRIRGLSDILIEGVENSKHYSLRSSKTRAERSGIINIGCKDPHLIDKRLRRKHVIVSVRDGGIRVSPHFYNLESEIQKFLEFMTSKRAR